MLQIGCLIFAALWLGTVALWRWDVARRKDEADTAWAGAERDRNDAIAARILAEKAVAILQSQLDTANADIDRRSKAQFDLDRANQQAKADILALKKTADDLKAANAAQRTENAALHADLDANSARMAALLDRLRTNVNAKKPAPWKALAARLLQEYADA